MTGRTVKVLTRDATQEQAERFPTPVPGLVIIADLEQEGAWAVTHARSGAALARRLPDPELALHVAIKLGGIADWTLSGVTLRADRAVRVAWEAVMHQTGASLYVMALSERPDSAIATAEGAA